MNKEELKKTWAELCNTYLEAFCERHGYRYEPDMWVADDPGTIVEVCDMFTSMDVIRYDVDNNIEPDKFPDWYWKGLEVYELTGQKYMNYPSYCKGAPDEWTDERMEKIRESHRRIAEEEEKLKKYIEDYEE